MLRLTLTLFLLATLSISAHGGERKRYLYEVELQVFSGENILLDSTRVAVLEGTWNQIRFGTQKPPYQLKRAVRFSSEPVRASIGGALTKAQLAALEAGTTVRHENFTVQVYWPEADRFEARIYRIPMNVSGSTNIEQARAKEELWATLSGELGSPGAGFIETGAMPES